MNRTLSLLRVALLALLLPLALVAEENSGTEEYSLWIGSHYTDFSDYRKKVGEYNLGENEWLPEFRLNYLSQQAKWIFSALY